MTVWSTSCVLPSLLPDLVFHLSEATVHSEGQKIAEMRDYRPVGCHTQVSLCSGLPWEKLSRASHHCSGLLLHGELSCNSALTQSQGKPWAGSCGQAGKQPTFLMVSRLPSHSLFPLSSPQLQTSRQLEFDSLQRIPSQALLPKFTLISHR